ncbi:hypothetical protein H5410_059382 [Solanum commersonii]|uniref:Uncharacterized protein n=1 Tax=Solanum commersonii TaxID=4109 RepID=A0A9J5W2Q6_SOLCO|nr:hypothetical protein H5410_059382 [Solanum commersonii]
MDPKFDPSFSPEFIVAPSEVVEIAAHSSSEKLTDSFSNGKGSSYDRDFDLSLVEYVCVNIESAD